MLQRIGDTVELHALQSDNHDAAKDRNPVELHDGNASGLPADTTHLRVAGASKSEVGQIVKLNSHMYVHYVRSNDEIRDWDTDTSSLPLVPVLHHGTMANEMKSRFYYNNMQERCRRSSTDCPFAHSWDERLEYICPACTEDGLLECVKKRQHISNYRLWGIYAIEDGRSVSDYLNFGR